MSWEDDERRCEAAFLWSAAREDGWLRWEPPPRARDAEMTFAVALAAEGCRSRMK